MTKPRGGVVNPYHPTQRPLCTCESCCALDPKRIALKEFARAKVDQNINESGVLSGDK